jgi:deoxyadenosine/deoxycytidine kinase
MIIEIAGNIASGKSTLAKALSDSLGYKCVGIDDYRAIGYNESMAKSALYQDVFREKHIIYETTTCNKVHNLIEDTCRIRTVPVLKILIWCSADVCLSRFYKRTENKKFPYSIRIEDSVSFIENQLKYYKPDCYFSESITTEKMAEMVLKSLVK